MLYEKKMAKCLGFLIIILVLGIGIVHTASGANKPEWIEGKSKKYPDELYVIGVGYGDNRKAAEDAAYAAIARIFQAEIQSKTREWEKYAQTDIKGKTQSTRDIQIDQLTTVATNKVLEDITIADIWVSESEKLTYALGIMERSHAMASLKDKITSLDKDINDLQKKATDSTDKIESVRLLRSTMKA